MIDFLFILFFGNTILLTATPIDIPGIIFLSPEKPITALTFGASIQIDVSSMIAYKKGEDITKFREKIAETFPAQSIHATLFTDKGNQVKLTYDGSHMFNSKQVLLSLYSESGVPLKTKFDKIEILSLIKLTDIQVYWKNHRK